MQTPALSSHTSVAFFKGEKNKVLIFKISILIMHEEKKGKKSAFFSYRSHLTRFAAASTLLQVRVFVGRGSGWEVVCGD